MIIEWLVFEVLQSINRVGMDIALIDARGGKRI